MKDRLKEIKHRKYEIVEELKALKRELLDLKEEENQIIHSQRNNKVKKKGNRYDKF